MVKVSRVALTLTVWVGLVASSLGQSTTSSKPREPVAVIGGETIYDDDLSSVASQLQQLRKQEYDLKLNAIENLLFQKLLESESKKVGVSSQQLLEREADSRVSEPADSEIEAYYLGQKDRLKRPLEEIKTQIRQILKQGKLQQARQEYFKRLREKADVKILLRPPKFEITYDPARMRGKPNAPIVIVEFADFQCPFCQAIQPTLAGLLAKYEGKVSFAFRDFPLRPIHPLAQGAAEAARCAADQGKFWEYYDRLYTAPSRLEPENLAEHARSAGLDEARFRSCVASGKFRAHIEQDLQDGAKAGVAGTPTFFINGVPVSGVQPASVFEKIIEAELEAIKTQKPGAKQ